MRHFKTCPFLGLPVFQPEVLKDPEENPSLESKQMATKGEQKNLTGVVGSLATPFSETSNDDDDTAGKGPGRGKARSRLLCGLRAPPATKPSPPSRRDTPGDVSTSPRGRRFPWLGLGRGQGQGLSSHSARAAWRGPRGRSCRAHPHAHRSAPRPPSQRPAQVSP